jgi:hypothetical protein
MELIKKLQDTQAEQKKMYDVLETMIKTPIRKSTAESKN